ncbi:lipopolysaccharide biosynthesis protein [Paenibacillus pectinilyticus]|uniref:Lipopolysaccharide biosynthesis protein n=1 Tax=Paenibacillus pectinilyticus TaxID=512399 RepID=A0A1C0ZRL4_9BACL|nr:Wzz/FepE/Etk N-terminal domain-containing protein [Paenibacillus pectinilyticus]OCT10695.1 lipopolysaccharide biosynthesis protein [Paenibacillus pectinilyticus]
MELDLKDYLKIIRKRVWMIVAIVAIATMTTGVVSYFFLQPIYEASTKLIVNKSNDQVGVSTQVDLNTVNLNIRLIDTYKEIIRTPRIMDKVVADYPDLKISAEQLINTVKVSSVNNTQVMTLIVQDPSYERAASIVNAVSVVFQSEIPKIMKVDNISLLNEAKDKVAPIPVKPNKKLNVAISFVVSLMIALGIAFLLEYLNDQLTTEEEVEQFLGLPTLAMITKMRPEDFQNHSKQTKESRVGGQSDVKLNQ